MKTQVRKRYTLLLAVSGLTLPCFLWVRAEQRQYAMNRELIQALAKADFKRSLQLVEAGADPNTRVEPSPPPTWQELLKHVLHHSAPSSNTSPTALMVVCGDIYWAGADFVNGPPTRFTDPQLVPLTDLMLSHGGDVNARDDHDWTALQGASRWGLTGQMTLLLKHGAQVDQQDDYGQTSLHKAAMDNNAEAVKLLLKYHANPNVRDKDGNTPLKVHQSDAGFETIRLLKSAGATE